MVKDVVYEIRTIRSGKVDERSFVEGPQGLYDAFKTIDPETNTCVFEIVHDDNGDVVSGIELSCAINGNSFVITTLAPRPKKNIREVDAPSIVDPAKDVKQVYDIALLLKTPLKVKRVLPVNPDASTESKRVEKTLKVEGRTSPVRKVAGAVSRGISKKTRTSGTLRAGKSHRKN